MAKNKRGVFAPNSVLEGAGLFLAIFLILAVLVKFVFFPAGTAEAASSEKSLFGLELNIERLNSEDTFSFEYPLSIGKDIWFVSFSKEDASGYDGIQRSPECKTFTDYSCLCMCKDENCEIVIECSDFKEFDRIDMMDSSGSSTRTIVGGGEIKQLLVSKEASDKNLHITVG